MSNQNETTPATETETPARKGRKPSFPGRDTVAVLAHLPVETRQMLRDVATKREEAINVTLNRFIESGYKAAMRNRKS